MWAEEYLNFSSVGGKKFLEIWTNVQMPKLEETFSISEVFKYFRFG